MRDAQTNQGLLILWGGFKSSIDREIPMQFCRVRLWDRKAFIGELLAHYGDKLDDIKAEMPLKRIGTYAAQDDQDSAVPDSRDTVRQQSVAGGRRRPTTCAFSHVETGAWHTLIRGIAQTPKNGVITARSWAEGR